MGRTVDLQYPLSDGHVCKPAWLLMEFLVRERDVEDIARQLRTTTEEVEEMLGLCGVREPFTHPRPRMIELAEVHGAPAVWTLSHALGA